MPGKPRPPDNARPVLLMWILIRRRVKIDSTFASSRKTATWPGVRRCGLAGLDKQLTGKALVQTEAGVDHDRGRHDLYSSRSCSRFGILTERSRVCLSGGIGASA